MSNFLISFNVVFPIAVMMALGFFMKKIKLMNETTVKQVNNVIFRVFLPTMIFKNIYDSEISEVFDPKLVLYAIGAVIALIVLLFIIVPIFEKDNSKRGVLIQAIFRSNFVIFGIPVTEALCGKGVTGAASVLIALVIPIFNFAAVVSLEVFKGNKPDVKKILKGIVTNPLIIASVLGLAVNFSGIRFFGVIEKSIGNVASVTTPLALIILGASINFSTVGQNLRHIIVGLSARLILVPAVFLFVAAYVFGFRGADLT
ncbi:MAG: AEC family transporter, partial [Ruminococcaceae bacterium]|nr:AEC family transporter [Oscillospiraceae bacterium]